MGTADKVEVMFVQELCHHIRPEGERYSTIILAPAHDILKKN